MPITSEQLDLARELFAGDTDQDIRNLAFIEISALIGNRTTVKNLEWKQIRSEERAIVFERYCSDYNRDTFQSRVWYEETARYTLTDDVFTLLERLSNRIDERSEEWKARRLDCVFLHVSYHKRFYHYPLQYGKPEHYFRPMHNTEPAEIIALLDETLKERAVQVNERAIQIQEEIARLRKSIEDLEYELAGVINPEILKHRERIAVEHEQREFRRQLGYKVHSRAIDLLWARDIRTIDQLCALSKSDLLAIKGIGKTALAQIEEALSKLITT